MHTSKFLLLVVLLAPMAADAQISMRPGQYEVTLNMDLGIPKEASKAVLDAAGLQNDKRLECYTAQEVADMKDFSKAFAREAEEANCKMSDLKTAGNKLTFTTTCADDDVSMTSSTEITFGTDSFTGVTRGKDNEGRSSTIKMSAKRIGECPKQR